MTKKVKVGVVGAGRGSGMVEIMSKHPDAELVAVCDKYVPALDRCRSIADANNQKIETYTDYDKFLSHDMDAIVLANYANEHAPFAIKALESGRHVVSEVLAVENMAEAVALAEAVEKSGKIYSYAENYCYFKSTLEMKKLYKSGALGEFQHGEGEYVHDCESIWHLITYGERNHWRNWTPATFYCTHAAGPIMTITGLRPEKVVAFETPNISSREYGRIAGDGSMILCQMSNGGTAKFLQGGYRRSPDSIWYSVYGTNGMVESDRFGSTIDKVNYYSHESKELKSYIPEIISESELAKTTFGHGGSDFYTMDYFLDAILDRRGKEEIIDVYQALDMTIVGTIGFRSIMEGNIPLEIPDLRDKSIREKYRNDHYCCNPKYSGEGEPIASSRFEKVEIKDEVYDRIREEYNKAVEK